MTAIGRLYTNKREGQTERDKENVYRPVFPKVSTQDNKRLAMLPQTRDLQTLQDTFRQQMELFAFAVDLEYWKRSRHLTYLDLEYRTR